MFKLVKDWTLKDYDEYGDLRICDGKWNIEMALTCFEFFRSLPKKKWYESKKKYNAKVEKIFQEQLPLLWNLKDYPNLAIDIETGEISLSVALKEKEKQDKILEITKRVLHYNQRIFDIAFAESWITEEEHKII